MCLLVYLNFYSKKTGSFAKNVGESGMEKRNKHKAQMKCLLERFVDREREREKKKKRKERKKGKQS